MIYWIQHATIVMVKVGSLALSEFMAKCINPSYQLGVIGKNPHVQDALENQFHAVTEGGG